MGNAPRVGCPSQRGESGKWLVSRFSVDSSADQVLKSPPMTVVKLSIESNAATIPNACRSRVAFPLIKVRTRVDVTSRCTLTTRIRSPLGPGTVATTATLRPASKGSSMAASSAKGSVDKIALPLSSANRPGSSNPLRADGT